MEAPRLASSTSRLHHNTFRLNAMSNENMKLWNQVCVTDPKAVKAITGKPYKGHSPKPYWLIQRATEVFGPCGQGWGVEVKSESFHRMTETDVMHSAVVTVWYMQDGKRCQIEQMGQTKACYEKSGGGMMLDEDAGKKSVTDGMVKCLSMIGFAGDIFSGRWDDSNYVEWAGQQFEEPPQRMSDDAIASYQRQFDEATTAAALKVLGDKASAVADAMGDTEARELLGKAYVTRKKQLTTKKEAA
jgi:hypothetical protein